MNVKDLFTFKRVLCLHAPDSRSRFVSKITHVSIDNTLGFS